MPSGPAGARGIPKYFWEISISGVSSTGGPTSSTGVSAASTRRGLELWMTMAVQPDAAGSRRARRDLVPRSRGLLDLVSLTQRARSSRAAARLKRRRALGSMSSKGPSVDRSGDASDRQLLDSGPPPSSPGCCDELPRRMSFISELSRSSRRKCVREFYALAIGRRKTLRRHSCGSTGEVRVVHRQGPGRPQPTGFSHRFAHRVG